MSPCWHFDKLSVRDRLAEALEAGGNRFFYQNAVPLALKYFEIQYSLPVRQAGIFSPCPARTDL